MIERRNAGVFVTGTDTGVGKTWACIALLEALRRQGCRVAGMKPIASGCEETPAGLRNEDALLLQRHSALALPYERVNPCRYAPPIAPHIAARRAGREISVAAILQSFEELRREADFVVVEGVGGWRVPLGPDLGPERTLADLAHAMRLPVLLVVGLRLGCLNHALLSAEAIRADGLELKGWVANRLEPGYETLPETLETLSRGLGAPPLGLLPFVSPPPPADRLADGLEEGVRHAFREALPAGGGPSGRRSRPVP